MASNKEDRKSIVNSSEEYMESNDYNNETKDEKTISKKMSYFVITILLVINLLNYMDRYTLAGVLKDVQLYYGLDNSEGGLLQTVFVISYMLFSPLFGYLGDRYTRKYIIAVGIFFWSGLTLAGSFVDKDHFYVLVIIRGLVGIGEASYSTVAPALIADLYTADMRTKMLIAFNVAVPVGSGLGFIVGSNVAQLLGGWQWALRVTPVFGVVCVVLVLLMPEPVRGKLDGGLSLKSTNVKKDLFYVLKNKSWLYSTLGFTCVAFVSGTLALWSPTFMLDSIKVQGRIAKESSVSFIFGAITMVAGLLGVAIGGESSRRYKKRNPRADPLVCAIGLFVGTPFLYLALLLSRWYTVLAWICIFIGETAVLVNWSIVNDILLYVTVPTRRAMATAVQILTCHLLGDAGSPYLIGVIADALAKNYHGSALSPSVQYITLQNALYICPFVSVVGAGFFLVNAIYIVEDKAKAIKDTKESQLEERSTKFEPEVK